MCCQCFLFIILLLISQTSLCSETLLDIPKSQSPPPQSNQTHIKYLTHTHIYVCVLLFICLPFFTCIYPHFLYVFCTYTRCVRKKNRTKVTKKIMSNPNYKLQIFPCKIILLESNAFSYPSPPCFRTFLVGFSRDSLQLHRLNLLDSFQVRKRGPVDDSLVLGEKGKNRTELV